MVEKVVNPDWSHKKLNELGFVGRGKSRHRPRNDTSLYEGAYPFIQTGDIKAANFYISEYSQTYNEKGLSQSKLWEPNTLCITIVANIAETAILKIKACFPDSIVGFIADQKEADVRFIKYYIDTIKLSMQNVSKGTTQDNLSLDKLLTFDFLIPTLPTQRKIATILSAYDNLIENNMRRIKILEEIAQALYREWFVEFRFPGHETMKMVESELGMVPEGWEVKVLGELLKHHIGGGWGEEKENNNFSLEAYVIRGKDIPFARYVSIKNCPLRYHKESNLKSRRLEDKDIVFEVSGGSKGQPVGRALLISQKLLDAFNKDVICASFCKLLRINNEIIIPEIIHLHLLEIYENGNIEKYQTQSTGIINFKFSYFIEKELIVIPEKDLQIKFDKIICPIFNMIQSFGLSNANLLLTRDFLLPKLISGEGTYPASTFSQEN